jgi:DNA modification methylase
MAIRIEVGDCLEVLRGLPDASLNACVTSPPYFGLRDYGHAGQIGLEETPDAFVAKLVEVFREVRRVLRDDGTVWLNLGDSYNAHPGQRKTTDKAGEKQQTNRGAPGAPSRCVEGIKPKDLIGIPWRVAFALQADGWYLRQDIIWHKPNPMPESVTDRCTKAHEYIFLLSKSARYWYDAEAIEEDAKWERWGDQTEKKQHAGTAGHLGGKTLSELPVRDKKNRRSVWTVATQPYSGAHFATFPPALIEPCILAGCPEGGTVLDPFGGAGTTGLVADRLGRNALLIELNPEYAELARHRIYDDAPLFAEVR